MSLSELKKLPVHKCLDTDLALWKRSGKQYTTKHGITYVPYRCLMRHRCKCKYLIHTAAGKNFLQIEQSGLHDASSHENDGSKYLKYDQIISIHDAAVTTPSLSGVVIRQNMLMLDSPSKTIGEKHKRCVQRRVRAARKEST